MKTMIGIAAVLAIVAPGVSATAQHGAGPANAEIAAARAEADRLIAAAEAEAIFENITADGVPTVRHRASGLTCAFSDPSVDRITIYPAGDGLKIGDDVGCTMRSMGVDFTSYATRYADQYPADLILDDAMAAIQRRWPDAKIHQGSLITASSGDGPGPLVGGYDVELDGKPMITLVFVQHVGDWSFKGRATGPQPAMQTNLLGAAMFSMGLPGSDD